MDVEEGAAEEEMDVDEEGEKTEKKDKKRKKKEETGEKKDKKPQSSYFAWMNGVYRAQWKAENPDAKGVTELTKAASVVWKEMSEEDKQPFKDKYDEDMVGWRERNPSAKKAKAEKGPRDADAKPLTAYMSWMNDVFRPKFKAENPDVKGVTECTKAAAIEWNAMPEEDKAVLQEAYGDAMKAWRLKEGIPEPKEKVPKPPASLLAMYIKDHFSAHYKLEHAEDEQVPKAAEIKEAAKVAFDALSESETKAWDVKYGARLVELGINRAEHDTKEAEKAGQAAKTAKAPKVGRAPCRSCGPSLSISSACPARVLCAFLFAPPSLTLVRPSALLYLQDAFRMFQKESFEATYKEANPEAKPTGKEFNTAAKEAWEALTEEAHTEWETKRVTVCEELGVDPNPPAASSPPSGKPAKPVKPVKEKVATWKELFKTQARAAIMKKKPDAKEEDVDKEAELRLKNASKAELMGHKDKNKSNQAKADKKYDIAIEGYEKDLADWEAAKAE